MRETHEERTLLKVRSGPTRDSCTATKNVGVPLPSARKADVAFTQAASRNVPKSRSLQWAAPVPSAGASPSIVHALYVRARSVRGRLEGHHDETSPPKEISASGRERCRAACESASNLDPTPIEIQIIEAEAELLISSVFDRRPTVTPLILAKIVLVQRITAVSLGV
jgi:hypothetical protein